MASSYSYELEVTSNVRPTIAPRSLVITRSSAYGSTSGSRNTRSAPAIGPGALALIQSSGVGALKTTRDKEKKDMQVRK
jgi:hypothetical protein